VLDFYHPGAHISALSYRRALRIASTRVVQEILVHANIRQTMDTYSHVLPNMQQQAAERMDEMLG
jgi:integrase